jgi:hypothetical protein
MTASDPYLIEEINKMTDNLRQVSGAFIEEINKI